MDFFKKNITIKNTIIGIISALIIALISTAGGIIWSNYSDIVSLKENTESIKESQGKQWEIISLMYNQNKNIEVQTETNRLLLLYLLSDGKLNLDKKDLEDIKSSNKLDNEKINLIIQQQLK